jgi:hypothetical protein
VVETRRARSCRRIVRVERWKDLHGCDGGGREPD